jgi:hypothetical protein
MLSYLAQYIRIGYKTGLACYESEIGDAFNLKNSDLLLCL